MNPKHPQQHALRTRTLLHRVDAGKNPRPMLRRLATGAALVTSLMLLAPPALAVDGCLALLCFAAPDWRAIPACVPTITTVLHDLAHGRPFPSCAMAGAGNQAGFEWARAPGNCPPQYTRVHYSQGGPDYSCDYSGVVSVNVSGALWSRTWWSVRGASVTEFTPAAKASLGHWNTQYDVDYAAWLASQAASPTN